MSPDWRSLAATLAAAAALGCGGGGSGGTATTNGPDHDAGPAFASADLGRPERNADLPVGPVDITLTNTAAGGPVNTTWVAFSDGDGPWHEVPGRDGVYSFQVRAPRFGLAYVCPYRIENEERFYGQIIQATVLDLQALHTRCQPHPARPAYRYKVSVAVTGPLHHETKVVFGSPGREPQELSDIGGGSANYEFVGQVLAGTYDVTVYQPISGARVVVRHGVTVAADTTLAIDLTQEGITLVDQDVRLVQDGRPLTSINAEVELHTAGGGRLTTRTVHRVGGPAQAYRALPAADVAPGDVQVLRLWFESSGLLDRSRREVKRGFRAPIPMQIDFIRPFTAMPELTAAAATPYFRARAAFSPHPDADFYSLAVGFTGNIHTWTATVTTAWLEQQTSYELPDLSGAPGWKAEWGPSGREQQAVTWTATRSDRPLAESIGPSAGHAEGATLGSVSWTKFGVRP